ncbi:MAG: VCBS repeat-containing protein, partial [Victivallales bacterium]|nr:VCBS repeat-containing protein [Victivallales bacterium]
MPKGILNSVISASLLILSVSCSSAEKATFTRVTLETVGETNGGYVALADLNGDGKADLVAGLQWFEGPSWTRHP